MRLAQSNSSSIYNISSNVSQKMSIGNTEFSSTKQAPNKTLPNMFIATTISISLSTHILPSLKKRYKSKTLTRLIYSCS